MPVDWKVAENLRRNENYIKKYLTFNEIFQIIGSRAVVRMSLNTDPPAPAESARSVSCS